jgi:hypothetical protein
VTTVAGWGFGQTISVDLTAVVQAWCGGQTPYYGLIIRGNNESFAHNTDKNSCLITSPELVLTKITMK